MRFWVAWDRRGRQKVVRAPNRIEAEKAFGSREGKRWGPFQPASVRFVPERLVAVDQDPIGPATPLSTFQAREVRYSPKKGQ